MLSPPEIYQNDENDIQEMEVVPATNSVRDDMLFELNDLVFKLRSHSEHEDNDRSMGFEEGLQMAAEMIENFIRRHKEDGVDLG